MRTIAQPQLQNGGFAWLITSFFLAAQHMFLPTILNLLSSHIINRANKNSPADGEFSLSKWIVSAR